METEEITPQEKRKKDIFTNQKSKYIILKAEMPQSSSEQELDH